MATWRQVTSEAPELAERARALLDAHKHKTLATLRRDGSPRISGIEAFFAGDDIWFGSMPRAVKALDLLRDPRFALHSGSAEAVEWEADAKVAGRAVEITDDQRIREVMYEAGHGAPSGPMHLFRADIDEVVVTGLGEPRDHLLIESWHEGRGMRRLKR